MFTGNLAIRTDWLVKCEKHKLFIWPMYFLLFYCAKKFIFSETLHFNFQTFHTQLRIAEKKNPAENLK